MPPADDARTGSPERAVVAAPATRRALAARADRAAAAAQPPDRGTARRAVRRHLRAALAPVGAVLLLTAVVPMLPGVYPGSGGGLPEAARPLLLVLLPAASLLLLAAHVRRAERQEGEDGRG